MHSFDEIHLPALIFSHQLVRVGLQLYGYLSRSVRCRIALLTPSLPFQQFPSGYPRRYCGAPVGISRRDGMYSFQRTSANTVLRVLFQISNLFNVPLAQAVGGRLPFL